MTKDFKVESFRKKSIPGKLQQFEDDIELTTIHVHLHKKRRDALKALFNAKGLNLSSGIRNVLYEWLASQLR